MASYSSRWVGLPPARRVGLGYFLHVALGWVGLGLPSHVGLGRVQPPSRRVELGRTDPPPRRRGGLGPNRSSRRVGFVIRVVVIQSPLLGVIRWSSSLGVIRLESSSLGWNLPVVRWV